MRSTVSCLLFACLLVFVAAWTKEDYEIFRLRDELEVAEGKDVSFYEYLEVKPSASQDVLEKAYRKKARVMHPDKAERNFVASRASASKGGKKPTVNRRPSQKEIRAAVKEANEKYQRLTVIKDVLTGPARVRYDHFLRNGFPKWRSSGYYYNRFRPGLISTLLGLWLFAGGAVHYGILVLGYRQRRAFIDRTIKKARKAAFGDESSTAGILSMDNLGTTVSAAVAMPSEESLQEENGMPEPRNRKERRMMEKMQGKETKVSKGPVSQKKAAAKAATEAAEKAANAPPVPKKRVMAENGKVLLVAKDGSVYLEEEDNEGNTEELLLSPDDVQKPTFRQTALLRAPIWAFNIVKAKITGKMSEEDEAKIAENSPDAAAEELKDAVEAAANVSALNGKKARRRV